jgi:(1->4)-alpha-D-glucan 1-alpha-D-glucosylmutase
MVTERMTSLRIPLSTYRLQFNRDFTFAQATEIIPYLAALGISHCYASPYLRARAGSTHGYDIIDHHHLNPEIGAPEEYERFVAALHEHGMGQLLDVVPNHMGVMSSDNGWWLDVLENGEASAYSDFFDIDWEPLKDELQAKVLLPVLADQYGIVLDRGELKLTFDREKGEFSIFYGAHRFPVNPREYPSILSLATEKLQQQLPAENEDLLELQSLASAFGHLPGRSDSAPEKRAERVRDKEIHKKRLAALCARSPQIAELLENTVATMNGVPGNSSSFDTLHELIKNQAYRLAHWRVAADDINYRRFFDVNELAALRQENSAVFNQTHEFVLDLLRQEKINGLRIDHPDGLYNPEQYFWRLQCGLNGNGGDPGGGEKRYYVVAEKILTGRESLPETWPIHGTTGYDFSNLVNALFVDPDAEKALSDTYTEFVGARSEFSQQVYECKKLLIDRSLNSELNVLANHLSRIALADRHTCDFTVKSLRDALMEVVACFPVYRTYVTEQAVSPSDEKYISEAIECAKSMISSADSTVYDFIREVLLTRQAAGHPQFYARSVLHFAMHFQQYTSAVMAKGLEDTSFYRYHRLISLNDVGGDPLRFGLQPEQFHAEIKKRASAWPASMLATSTHDSKRSEDVRARINVLSEVPDLWRENVARWRDLNNEDLPAAHDLPTRNDEYLLYQTLVGAWPSENITEEFVNRINSYMLKAVREAKENTSWAYPNQEYESALANFIRKVLSNSEFVESLNAFQKRTAFFGALNSLSQTVLKLTVPGVPDFYQGNELWEFNLVDPDNRRRVDYSARRTFLSEFQSDKGLAQCTEKLSRNMHDGRIKMYVIWQALGLRTLQPDLFLHGDYLALQVTGRHAANGIAFARTLEGKAAVIVVPRLAAKLAGDDLRLPIGERTWRETAVRLPAALGNSFCNVFTRKRISTEREGNQFTLRLSSVLESFPVALLTSE